MAGNHQDHQGGCVITAAIDKRISIEVRQIDEPEIRVSSAGFEPFSISLDEGDWSVPHPDEVNSTEALVRGMAAQLAARGATLSGCDLAICSDIPVGMGFSSSAAFEVCVGAALWALADCEIDPLAIAEAALVAERDFFGKPCGMMDQTACALGGVQFLDFSVLDKPAVTPLALPAGWSDWSYVLIDCGEGHAHTTGDFSRVALDMAAVARFLHLEALGQISQDDYLEAFDSVRESLGDGAALRGLHFFRERELVLRRLAALGENDMEGLVAATEDSGISSAEYLQNLSVPGPHQEAMVALALSRVIADELACAHKVPRGSARIHGGGFGGTIQVIIPACIREEFTSSMEALLGPGCCLSVELGGPGIVIEEVAR